MEQRLSLVTLGVTDIDRARAFYEALGWSGISPDGEVVFFQAGGMIVALWSRRLLAEDSAVSDGGGWGGITLAHNVASKEQVDAVLAEVRAVGATILKPATEAEWGGYSGYFADPDGYPWEVAWNPFFPFGADGNLQLPE
jgi:catechol 2,3-dioxygenase-like lactoylglutathione lyase family enzyme